MVIGSLMLARLLSDLAILGLPWVAFGVGMMLVAEAVEYGAGGARARRYGAKRPGVIGAVLGSIVGLVSLGPSGVVVGLVIGAIALELVLKRPPDEAIRAGVGATLGVLGGAGVKFLVVLLTVGVITAHIF